MKSLEQKISYLGQYGNEIAFGYDDSGCCWHFHHGNRGSGSMIDSCECKDSPIWATECDTFSEAVDYFLTELEKRYGSRELEDKQCSEKT